MKPITEQNIEQLAIEQLRLFGWEYLYGLAIAPGAAQQELDSFEQIINLQVLERPCYC